MAERFEALEDRHITFINGQAIYFVATAAADGHVNLSPKGQDSLRVLDNKRVAWLNLTGSGNESAAHVRQNPRMTLMFCSFEKQPLILRLYGTAHIAHSGDSSWAELYELFPAQTGARQIFVLDIDLVQTSCGFAVPFFEFRGHRETLANWAGKQGESGIRDYWQKKNRISLDGLDTGMPE